jgi:hypothetical protein
VNTALVRLLGSAFGSSEILSVSFMKSPLHTELDGTDTGLDFEEVKKFYDSLSDKKVRDLVLNGFIYFLLLSLTFSIFLFLPLFIY